MDYSFDCRGNDLYNLENMPLSIAGDFFCDLVVFKRSFPNYIMEDGETVTKAFDKIRKMSASDVIVSIID